MKTIRVLKNSPRRDYQEDTEQLEILHNNRVFQLYEQNNEIWVGSYPADSIEGLDFAFPLIEMIEIVKEVENSK